MPQPAQGVKHMAINVQARSDNSYLFSSFGTSTSNTANSNFLSDYASIKNGSYYKLMKAYYAKDGTNDSVKSLVNNSTSKDSSTTISKVQSASDALKDSADALLVNGSKSLFNKTDITTKDENGVETTAKGYDVDSIYKAVNQFVKDYNSVISATDASSSSSIQKYANSMTGYTTANKNSLSKIGITVNSDNTLSIDEDTFRKANMDTVKNLFNKTGSYGYRVSSQASMINLAAGKEADKASTYNASGAYSNSYNAGNIFNGYY